MTKKILLSVYFTILYTQAGICQSSTQTLSNWFDKTVGRENLGISNGYIANEQYITHNNTNLYLKNSNFSSGSVLYEDQFYTDLYINYDSYNDELLLKPNGTDDLKSIIVKKEYTSSFTFLDRNYVNLTYNNKKSENFLSGYYEEKIISKNLILYTKYSKTRSEKIDKNQLISEFSSFNQFVILYDKKYFKYSQSTIEQLFPNLKNQIKTFYSENSKIQNSDEKSFIEMLLIQINSLSK